MKKFLAITLVAALALGFAGCSKSATSSSASSSSASSAVASSSEETEKETWILAINATFPPFESVDTESEDGFVGIDIDIAKHIAEKLNVNLEIQDMQFSALVQTMTSGRADIIISGISPTEERLEVIDFTKPYFFPMNSIISVKDSGLDTLESLEGKKIGVSMGTSYANVAMTVAGAEVVELDNTPLVIQEILNGRCDAGIFDATQAVEFCAQNEGLQMSVIPADINLDDTFAIALPKGSENVEKINTILDEMKADGTLHEILVKWLGEEATVQYEETIAGLEIAQ